MIRVTLFIPPGHPAEGRHEQEYGSEWSLPQVLAAVAALNLDGVESAGFDFVRPPVGDALTPAIEIELGREAQRWADDMAARAAKQEAAEVRAILDPAPTHPATDPWPVDVYADPAVRQAVTEAVDTARGEMARLAEMVEPSPSAAASALGFDSLMKLPKVELQRMAAERGCDNVARQRKYLAAYIVEHPIDHGAPVPVDEVQHGDTDAILAEIVTAESATAIVAIRDRVRATLGIEAWTETMAAAAGAAVAAIVREHDDATVEASAAVDDTAALVPGLPDWTRVPWSVLIAGDSVLQDGAAEDDVAAMWIVTMGVSEMNNGTIKGKAVQGFGTFSFIPRPEQDVRARRGEAGAAVDTLHAGGIATRPLTNGAGV